MAETRTAIEIPDVITVRDLSQLMQISPINVIKELMKSGIMANINQQIDFDTAAIVAGELGFDPVSAHQAQVREEAEKQLAKLPAWRGVLAREKTTTLKPRPPVVTMLGHVDHGKTSLLDTIRQADVASGEAGGITQHIAAYQVQHNGQTITFLDTPGHAAFTAMRARGAQATDIAILVVAADDGLMPQTREAIDHAKAAHVPIVVALNKIDLASANKPRALQQLADAGLMPDEWDGDTLVIPVSAKMKKGIEDLLEGILLTAEELNPRANPDAEDVSGVVIEAQMERGRGVTATILVQNGTLRRGDTILVGRHFGRIKAMFDYRGKLIKEAGPSTPVSVSGLNGIPGVGEQVRVVESEKVARRIVDELPVEAEVQKQGPTLEDFFSRLQTGQAKTLNLIIKADVQGSLEPIISTVQKMENEEVSIEILRAATGDITDSDVMLASASGATILGFNSHPDTAARRTAASEGVDIKSYSIIYKLFEDVEKAIKGMLKPVYEKAVIGRAEVRQVFRIVGVGNIAGCYMRTGVGQRNALIRVIRGTDLVHEGPVHSLKHHQENVREIRTGFEFGVSAQAWDKFQPGDIIEFLVERRVDPV
jgi:translation initiation factor IF-2